MCSLAFLSARRILREFLAQAHSAAPIATNTHIACGNGILTASLSFLACGRSTSALRLESREGVQKEKRPNKGYAYTASSLWFLSGSFFSSVLELGPHLRGPLRVQSLVPEAACLLSSVVTRPRTDALQELTDRVSGASAAPASRRWQGVLAGACLGRSLSKHASRTR